MGTSTLIIIIAGGGVGDKAISRPPEIRPREGGSRERSRCKEGILGGWRSHQSLRARRGVLHW